MRNKHFSILIFLIILLQACAEKTIPQKEIYNKEFNWAITIPENFENVSAEEWAKMQEKGSDAVEKTYGEKVVNQAKTIFVFKSDQLNYFESNYQPFDTAIDGNFLESFKDVNEVLYETFITQMPDIEIDTTSSTEEIDGLDFQVFKMKVAYPNKTILRLLMYSRLFENKEFSVNIMYVDEEKGEKMIQSWKNSRFMKGN